MPLIATPLDVYCQIAHVVHGAAMFGHAALVYCAWNSGELVSVLAVVRFHEAVENPVVGLLIRTQIGFEVYGTNTELERVQRENAELRRQLEQRNA